MMTGTSAAMTRSCTCLAQLSCSIALFINRKTARCHLKSRIKSSRWDHGLGHYPHAPGSGNRIAQEDFAACQALRDLVCCTCSQTPKHMSKGGGQHVIGKSLLSGAVPNRRHRLLDHAIHHGLVRLEIAMPGHDGRRRRQRQHHHSNYGSSLREVPQPLSAPARGLQGIMPQMRPQAEAEAMCQRLRLCCLWQRYTILTISWSHFHNNYNTSYTPSILQNSIDCQLCRPICPSIHPSIYSNTPVYIYLYMHAYMRTLIYIDHFAGELSPPCSSPMPAAGPGACDVRGHLFHEEAKISQTFQFRYIHVYICMYIYIHACMHA